MGDKRTEKTELAPKKGDAVLVESKPIPASLHLEETPESWVRSIVGLEDGEGSPIAKVRLEVRQTRHEKFSRLLEIPIAGQTPSDLVQQITKEAEHSGYREVRVSAWFPRAKAPSSLFSWPTDDLGDVLDDEGDEDGVGLSAAVVRQALRHTEVFMTSMMQQQALTMRHLTEQNRELSRMAHQHMAERVEMIELIRKMRLENSTEESTLKRNDALVDSLQTLTNAVAMRLTDGKASPGAREDVIVKMLRGLGESITPEQEEVMRSALTPEQLSVLYELMRDPKKFGDRVASAKTQQTNATP